jgi:N-acetylglutamate synthase-like GNAT family acetyltransferase
MIKRVDIRKESVQLKLSVLQNKCLPFDTPYDTNFGSWWIATNNNRAIGFAGLVRSVSWTDCGYLCRAGVIPSARGQGLQKKFIYVRIRQAKAFGWKWLVTDTRHNPASANSLIATGFKMFEPTKPWGCKDTLYWRKRL